MKDKKDHPFKKTNMPLILRLFFTMTTLALKGLGKLSPTLAGKLALKLFMKPPNAKAPKREQVIRNKATLSYRTINNQKIALRVWEATNTSDDAPTVLISHGWAGRTSQFLTIIDQLNAEGYRVVGADMPAHGDSSGTHTNMLEAAHVLSVIAKEFGPLEAIIGHSFGTGTILLGIDKYQMQAPKIVLIAAYSRISYILDLFSDAFELSSSTRIAMQQAGLDQFGDTYGFSWNWENIAPINTIKNYHGNVFFIHDKTDHEVPLNEVSELHQTHKNANILITQGLGHRRILRDDSVASAIVEYLKVSAEL